MEGIGLAEKLHGIAPLLDLLQLLIWSGQLVDERPISAIVVAPVGSGKTSVLKMIENDYAGFEDDITSRTMSNFLRAKPKASHYLLGDMLSLFGHKSSTVKLSKEIIARLTGETLSHDPFTAQTLPEPRKLGIITAIPDADFPRYKRFLGEGGFLSRFMVITYKYSNGTQEEIHEFIERGEYRKRGVPFEIKAYPDKFNVELGITLARAINKESRRLKRDPIGFRAHRYIRTLVMAEAARNNRVEVKEGDLEAVRKHFDFFTDKGRVL